jgi:hypothetical protein
MNKIMTITSIFRGRHYSFHGDRVWFEECTIPKVTSLFVIACSVTYPTIQYPGGNFQLSKENLQKFGKCYHSRHGEWFYLKKPRQGDLFPSKELLETTSFVEQEAASLGWDITKPLHYWDEGKKACFLLASKWGISLAECILILEKEGIDGVYRKCREMNDQQKERDSMLYS